MDSWITRKCRAADVRVVVVASSVALITLLLMGCGRRYWNNFFGGPYELDPADLDLKPDDLPRPFVKFRADKFEDSGIEEVRTSSRYGVKTSESHTPYWVTEIGGKWLLVKSEDLPSGEVAGEIRKTPGDVSSMLATAGAGSFHRSYIDAGSYRTGGWVALVVAGIALGWAGFIGYRASQRLTNPRTHATARRVASWGDPAAVSEEVEAEMQHPISRKRGVTTTQNYVVRATLLGFDVFRWDELIWAHGKIVKRSVNFIPAGTEHHVVLHFADGTVTYAAAEAAVKAALATAQRRAPWAVFGHSDEIERTFQKDRRGFIEAVAERRANTQPPA